MCGNKFCEEEGVNKGSWSPEEDRILIDYVNTHGEGNWKTVAKYSGLSRCHKSCRRRWLNYLKPGILRGNISKDEEDLIIKLHQLLGNRWSLIAGRLPGRTDHEIKNYWNNTLVKKLKESSSSSSTLETLHDNEFEENRENDLARVHGSTEKGEVNDLTNDASFSPLSASTSTTLIHNNSDQNSVENYGLDYTGEGFNNLGFIDYDSWFFNREVNVEDYITLASSPTNDEILHSRDDCCEKKPLDVELKELASFLEVEY